MVPVRKPGRPLSSCPHPASRPCSCGQVTAAIPRKQKCHCGPSTAESPTVKAEDSDSSKVTDSSKSTTPQSPSKAINASFRVQKTATKNGAQSSSRRQSVDPVALERMDPNMLNIMPPYAGVPQKPPYGPMVYPMFPPHMPPHMMAPDGANGITNGHSSTLTNGHAPVEKPEKPTLKIASCCGGGGGGGTNGVATITPTTQSPTVVSSPLVQSDKKTKSCCSSGIDSPKTDAKADGTSASDATPPTGLIMPPFQAPMVMPNGMYPYYPQPTIFTYPPQYGSYLQPLQPEQWRQVMASMTFAAVPGAMPSPYGMPGAVPYQPQGQPHSATSSSHSAVGTSHQCTCGEGCQCVGCAAHPYNEATQNYVRSAWESMLDEPQSAGGHVHGDRGHTRINGHGRNGSTANESSNAEAIPGVGPGEGTKSPPAPQTPSDAASGMSDEQALSANDFFFVSYPFGDSCVGEMASCPCGEDCQCLGCSIHDNQIPRPITGDEL
ncbi:hypothetical protein EDB81DRAFT_771325 [Dactylonectria macrodidyma]|uniref:Copper-sensing transcription factor n=1 Tax=Dactylonectria macrodidyma TaxID=307937 RepID=A0A9P9FRE9_9HYPO|nr:hypothetical protein EDB81DRAFT_771325 [Dactylonectria macrodidyma]